MGKLFAVVFLSLVAVCSMVYAQSRTGEIDPVLVSPGNYKVLVENKHIRLVEYQLNPGEKDNWHTHPAKVSYVVAGGSLKITTAEGQSFVVEEQLNSASWFGAVGKHYAENVGKTPIHIVFVEIRNIESKKQDLNIFQADDIIK